MSDYKEVSTPLSLVNIEAKSFKKEGMKRYKRAYFVNYPILMFPDVLVAFNFVVDKSGEIIDDGFTVWTYKKEDVSVGGMFQ